MEMIQTYQGYFIEDGRFVSDGLLVKIPTRRRAIVNILDDEIDSTNHTVSNIDNTAERQERVFAIKEIIADALKTETEVGGGVLADADWDETSNLRKQTNAGLSRAVEL
jgi:hypothetical protein